MWSSLLKEMAENMGKTNDLGWATTTLSQVRDHYLVTGSSWGCSGDKLEFYHCAIQAPDLSNKCFHCSLEVLEIDQNRLDCIRKIPTLKPLYLGI